MNFYINNYYGIFPKNAIFPCVVLTIDNWNDYGYTTYFHMNYFENEHKKIEIGSVKILNFDEKHTSLPDYFQKLNHDYCSLGQNLEYYKILANLNKNIYIDILESLNDVVYNERIANNFLDLPGFKYSLIRFSEAEKAFKEGKKYLDTSYVSETSLNFTFKTKLPEAEDSHQINFNFSYNEYLPYRITALIGKNATGKTQVLAKIAHSLSGLGYKQGHFLPDRPPFSKVIAISYSAFDDFKRPDSTKTFSYKYCGIRDENGNIDLKKMKIRLQESFRDIKMMQRQNDWFDILQEMIDISILNKLSDIFDNPQNSVAYLDSINLSSGQNMILATITDVIANISEESLLLFDEPELHLHPNAISNLIRLLYKLLSRFNSFAIISTHSPIILQEIPSEFVRVFQRIGNVPLVRKLGIESFGENLTVITNEVFETINTESVYKEVLKTLCIKLNYNYEKILTVFNNNLSLNAKLYLKTYILSKKGKNHEEFDPIK